MKYVKLLLIIFFTFCVSFAGFAQEYDDSNESISQSIGAMDVPDTKTDGLKDKMSYILDNSYFNKTQIGIMVYDLTVDSVIYTHDEKQLLRPASTMKLLTSITALNQLGGNYYYSTTLYYSGFISGRTLEGDLYCKGGFDPTFDEDMMDKLVAGVKRLGIDTIRGGIYADLSFKDDKMWGEGWCWDDPNYTLTPLLYNRKDNFMPVFIKKLRGKKIVCDNASMVRGTPYNAVEVVTVRTSIRKVLEKMMKDSDNLYAESMLYQTAAAVSGYNSSATNGLDATRNIIRNIGLDPTQYNFADGSGLSLYNYVSAELECMLLKYAYQNGNIYTYLYPSLPIAGRDGTLKKRMKGSKAANNVHAKTGTLKGVSSLAGYCRAANGHQLCFAIIDQGVMKTKEAKFFQNKICQILCNYEGY